MIRAFLSGVGSAVVAMYVLGCMILIDFRLCAGPVGHCNSMRQ